MGGRAAQLDGLLARSGCSARPGHREPHTAEVQQGGVDAEPVRDLAQAVVHHGVAGDQSTPSSWPSQLNAKPTTSPVIGRLIGGPWRQGVAVTSIVGRPAARAGWSPGREAAGVATEPLRAATRGHDAPADGKQRAAGGVEVVAVVVVAEQDSVDRAELRGGDRRAGELARRRSPAEGVRRPGASNVGSVSNRQPPNSIRQSARRCA